MHDYREIGWHCASSNAGSIATARKVGFEKERDYVAYSGSVAIGERNGFNTG